MKIKTIILLSVICVITALGVTFGKNSAGISVFAQTVSPDAEENTNRRADPDAANWGIETLDTAKNAAYLSPIEKDVILEMNKARTNPQKYAKLYIQPRLKYFNGKNYSAPGQISKTTKEGTSAVIDCIAVLNKAAAAGILNPDPGLTRAAKIHTADQNKTGRTGHTGSDRSSPESRIKRYGTFSGSWTLAENIAYGPDTGREIVCNLLINDGVRERGHRTSLMNDEYTQTGVGAGTHARYRTMCTITYADGYTSNFEVSQIVSDVWKRLLSASAYAASPAKP